MKEGFKMQNLDKLIQMNNELRKQLKSKIYAIIVFLVVLVGMAIFYRANLTILILLSLSIFLYSIALKILRDSYVKLLLNEPNQIKDEKCLMSRLKIIKNGLKADTIANIITLPSALILTIIIWKTFTTSNPQEIIQELKSPGLLLFIMIFIGFMNYYMNEYNYREEIKKLESQVN